MTDEIHISYLMNLSQRRAKESEKDIDIAVEHEIHDLREFCWALHKLLTPEQRKKFIKSSIIVELLEWAEL